MVCVTRYVREFPSSLRSKLTVRASWIPISTAASGLPSCGMVKSFSLLRTRDFSPYKVDMTGLLAGRSQAYMYIHFANVVARETSWLLSR